METNQLLFNEVKDMKVQMASLAAAQAAGRFMQDKVDINGESMLRPIDRKVVPKPTKYAGDVSKFPDFQDELKDYLHGIDHRWKELLEAIELISKLIEYEDETKINETANLTSPALRAEFKQQLFTYLKAFTDGIPYKSITAGGYIKYIYIYM